MDNKGFIGEDIIMSGIDEHSEISKEQIESICNQYSKVVPVKELELQEWQAMVEKRINEIEQQLEKIWRVIY